MDASDCSSVVSEDSQPPRDVVYPCGEEVEVPDTNGGLFKTVLVEGTGSKPVKGSKVSVHYVGTLLDGTVFDSSRERDQYFEFTLAKGQVIKGWDKGVSTMRIGEKAVLKCSPDYAYGAAGSPPTIPPNSTLLFEVELFSWTRSVDISPAKDQTLMKDILVDGVDYENPGFESKLTLDLAVYVGPYEEDRKAELQPVWQKSQWEVELGETALPAHLETCLLSMRKNEVATFRVRSDLLPNGDADFSIPSLADRGAADISYLVSLHALSTVKTWEFSGEEKIAQGVVRKEKGNAAFGKGNLELAEKLYRRALEFVGEDYGFGEDEKKHCGEVRVAVWGNLAQVLLLLRRYAESATFSQKVLDADKSNVKALFRLAKAKDGLQEWDEATQLVKKILDQDPGSVDAQQLLAHLHEEQRAFDRKQKSMFQRMFA